MAYETIAAVRPEKVRTAIFASGAGSIAQALIEFGLQPESRYGAVVLISNNSMCGARQIAENFSVPFRHISSKTHPELMMFECAMLEIMQEFSVEIIVLSGYNKLMPAGICSHFRGKILNIHPALLPKYGGAGMFGHVVHQRVIENRELFSGSTVHIVDEFYDHGEIIEQSNVEIAPGETPETLEAKIKAKEKEMYPRAVDSFAARIMKE